jgi:hypothetical protein
VVVLAGGSVALDGPTGTVLSDRRLEEVGVAAPAAVRLRRAAEASGLSDAWRSRLLEALRS